MIPTQSEGKQPKVQDLDTVPGDQQHAVQTEVGPKVDAGTAGADLAFLQSHAVGNEQDLEAFLSHTLRTQLTIITLLSTNLDLLYDRLDEKKRRQMIRDLREQSRLLNGLVVNALEILQSTKQ
jgi:signal transduction histidine kinase